ncbi:DNA internalization-related competence protein ComEC/Rec2 [Megalodesulfovibrio paquesii]
MRKEGPASGTGDAPRTLRPPASCASRLPPLLPWHACLLAFCLGCLAWEASWAGLPAAGVLFLFCRELLYGRERLAAFGGAFVLGVALAWLATWDTSPPDWMERRTAYQVSARVLERESLPDDRLRCILDQIRLTGVSPHAHSLDGRLAWTWDSPPPELLPHLLPGARIETALRVGPVGGFHNFGSQSSEGWWERQGVVARAYSRGDDVQVRVVSPGRWDERVRAALLARTAALLAGETLQDVADPAEARRVRRTLLEHQGSALTLAMSFGERQWLSTETVERVRRASLAHSIALSGSNVGFVALLGWGAAWVLGWLRPGLYLWMPRRKWGILFGCVLVAGFVWLAGGSPSLLRAALMYGVWAVLAWRGRPAALLDGLFLAVGLLLLASPAMALDLRLQLSVAAVAGITWYVGVLGWRWQRSEGPASWACSLPGLPGLPGWLRSLGRGLMQLAGVTLAAQAALMPLQLWHFSELQSSVWSNLVWVPLLNLLVSPAALFGVVLTGVSSWVPGCSWCTGLAAICLDVAAFAGEALLAALRWLDGQGVLQSHAAIRPHWAIWLGWWGLLAGTAIWAAVRRLSPWHLAGVAASAVMLSAGLWPTVWPETGTVRLTALDVGQGQALVLEGPDGSRALIDGGGFHSRTFDPGRSLVLPALAWLRRPGLELVFISHHDVDHLRGCYYAISHLGPQRVFSNGGEPGSDWDKARLKEALAAGELHEEALVAGESVLLGDPAQELRLTSLAPLTAVHGSGVPDKSGNADSLVLRVEWQGRALAILPGDIERPDLERLVERMTRTQGGGLAAAALVLPHHGAASSLSTAFLDAVRPAVAIASAGRWNQWGFPSASVRAALAKRSIPLLVTGESGAVRLEWTAPSARPEVTTARGN